MYFTVKIYVIMVYNVSNYLYNCIIQEEVSMKKISRKKTRISLTFILVGMIFIILGSLSTSMRLYTIGVVSIVVGIIIFFTVNKCPYCGKYFRGMYWSKKDAGYCKKCGKKLEYDS